MSKMAGRSRMATGTTATTQSASGIKHTDKAAPAPDDKVFTIKISEERHRQLKVEAANLGLSMKNYVLLALDAYKSNRRSP